MTGAPHSRDGSLDAFRGIDVILMIMVNLQGSDDAAFALLKHAEWNGLTFADLVFPIFLLVTGLAVPLAIDAARVPVRWSAIARRALLLFLIGVVLGWLIKPSFDPGMIRWAGVLQRIAIVYLLCAAVAMATRGALMVAALAATLLVAHAFILLYVPAPGDLAPNMAAGTGISGWLDQHFLPGRVHRVTWDPEGVLSTLSSIAMGLIGMATMRWMRARGGGIVTLLLLGAVLATGGYALTGLLPLNKGLWTPSFALVTSGIGLGVWAILRMTWGLIGTGSIGDWLAGVGRAALTIYVAHMLLIAVIVRQLPDGRRIWAALFDALVAVIPSPPVAALTFAMIGTGAMLALLPMLRRRGWLLKV